MKNIINIWPNFIYYSCEFIVALKRDIYIYIYIYHQYFIDLTYLKEIKPVYATTYFEKYITYFANVPFVYVKRASTDISILRMCIECQLSIMSKVYKEPL